MRRVNIVVLVEHIVRVNDIDGCGVSECEDSEEKATEKGRMMFVQKGGEGTNARAT
jgi:hypothetical protein